MVQKPCPRCGGSGEVLVEIRGDPRSNGQDQEATVQRWERCGGCGGSGRIEVPDDEGGTGGRR